MSNVETPLDREPRGRPDDRVAMQQRRGWFIGLAGIAIACNLVFAHLAGGRLGSTASSALTGLLGALSAAAIVSLGLQLCIANLQSRTWRGRTGLGRFGPGAVVLACLGGITVGLAAAALVEADAGFRVRAGALVAITTATMAAAIPARGRLLARQHWLGLGASLLVGSAVRLGLAVLLVHDGAFFAAVLASLIGEVSASAVAMRLSRPDNVQANRWERNALRHVVVAFVAACGLMVVLVLQSVASRSRLANDAPTFVHAAQVGRMVFFAAFGVAFLHFPAIVAAPIGSDELRQVFHRAVLWTSATAIAAAAVVCAAPQQFVRMVVAQDEVIPSSTVRLLAIAAGLSGIAVVSVSQYLAHGSRLAWTTWIGAGAMSVAHLVSSTAEQLAIGVTAGAALLLIAVTIPAFTRVRVQVLRPQLSESLHAAGTAEDQGITVVVPCYNGGELVVATVHRLRAVLDEIDTVGRIVVVSDGSTDGSDDLLDELDVDGFVHLRQPRNFGKGAALRRGFAHATTPLVAFIDADGDLDPRLVLDLIRARADVGADIAFGSKRHPNSTVEASRLRLLYSRGYQALLKLLFQLDIDDTQTGIKLYTRSMLVELLPYLEEDKFALDLELFVAARSLGYCAFVEIPVRLERTGDSTISLGAVRRMFTDTLRIFWRAKITLHYLRVAGTIRSSEGAKMPRATS